MSEVIQRSPCNGLPLDRVSPIDPSKQLFIFPRSIVCQSNRRNSNELCATQTRIANKSVNCAMRWANNKKLSKYFRFFFCCFQIDRRLKRNHRFDWQRARCTVRSVRTSGSKPWEKHVRSPRDRCFNSIISTEWLIAASC